MYSLEQLEAMAPAEAVAIAESMGMKKANSTDIQDVIYYILDNQAVTTAKEEASKVAARQNGEPKKRGRKKKNTEQDGQQTQPAPSNETQEPAPEPKKRGRKPKNQKAQEVKAEQLTLPLDETEETPAAQQEPAPKKRGRKPKSKVEDTPVQEVKAETKGADTKEDTKERSTVAEPETAVAEAKELPHAKKDKSSFDSFFGKSKGRTFTPRGKQEQDAPDHPQDGADTQEQLHQEQPRQEKPQNQQPQQNQQRQDKQLQPQQPRNFLPAPQQLMIQEPGANTQIPKTLQQAPKNMSKRQRQQYNRQLQQGSAARFPAVLDGLLSVYGVLEVMPEGFGFLRSSDYNYMPSPDDVYISQQQIKQYGLRMGDVVEASVRPPFPEEKYYPMVRPISINGLSPELIRDRAKFEHLVPLFPNEKFEITKGRTSNISTRIVDMFAPIGKGQRALIVAPPKTGKTILLKDIANAIAENHPETYIIMLLIDERPEEVTDMARSVNAEVIASTFDEPADRHVRIAGIVLEKAKRLVESGHDVVIMLDSITRLARAYNTVSPASGKILSGGVDANALQRPKRFFGAARNIEGGGSLTIIATALTETSSKMDEVIFEEFKGTGNMELQLDRKLSNKRVFPAVDIVASSTRRDDLLLPEETLNRMWILRNYLGDMNSVEAMEFIKKRMEMTRSNEELLVTMDQ